MREVGVHNWKIVPLITYACNRETICEFEQEWVKATGANLNTFSPVTDDLVKRGYNKKNKETKRYYCKLCGIVRKDNYNLKRHFDTYKHFMNWVWDID